MILKILFALAAVFVLHFSPGKCLEYSSNEEQCFQIIYPQPEFILSFPDEHKSVSLLFRVNCEGTPKAQSILFGSDWIPIKHSPDEAEDLFQVSISHLSRARIAYSWTLKRTPDQNCSQRTSGDTLLSNTSIDSRPSNASTTCSNSLTDESVAITLSGQALYSPELRLEFPQDGYAFPSDLEPFLMGSVLELAAGAAGLGPAGCLLEVSLEAAWPWPSDAADCAHAISAPAFDAPESGATARCHWQTHPGGPAPPSLPGSPPGSAPGASCAPILRR